MDINKRWFTNIKLIKCCNSFNEKNKESIYSINDSLLSFLIEIEKNMMF